jgi:hypothetical protein
VRVKVHESAAVVLAACGNYSDAIVTGAFLPVIVIVAEWQCARAWLKLRHLGLACGPVARTSLREGIAVPCTKLAAA